MRRIQMETALSLSFSGFIIYVSIIDQPLRLISFFDLL